ncbi:hypothetical protein PV439_32335, partial [Streptomyces scabiei]|nr:hypothetical protein [Streptomyces scabiei]
RGVLAALAGRGAPAPGVAEVVPDPHAPPPALDPAAPDPGPVELRRYSPFPHHGDRRPVGETGRGGEGSRSVPDRPGRRSPGRRVTDLQGRAAVRARLHRPAVP